MHLNDEKEHILFVFEGEKTEYAFYEALQNHNLSLKTKDREILSTFKADIYQLYKKIIEDDAEKLTQTLNQVYLNYDEFNEKFSKVKAESARFDINNVAQKYIDAYKSLSDQKVQVA